MIEIIMPKMGDAMTEGKVVRWYKKPGDPVKKGEPVAEIETDKVNLDLEAEGDGTLSGHEAAEGAVIPVGGVLARILKEGESAESSRPAPEKPASPKAEPEKKAAKEAEEDRAAAGQFSELRRATDRKASVKHTTGEYLEAIETRGPRRDHSKSDEAPAAATESAPGERRRSSPLARKIAQDRGIDLNAVTGSGPRGRIVAADVRDAEPQSGGRQQTQQGDARRQQPATVAPAASFAPQLETKIIPLSAMRRTIAKRLSESTGPIPHFFLTADFDTVDLSSLRRQLIDISGAKVSLNDFIIRAVALSLRHHPNVNASWGEEAITQHGEVHVGVAVATADGLITPVIRNADEKSVSDIAAEVRLLADKAKNRRLKPDEYQGSTFTISNLGAWGIEEFTAIINPPNVAILAIGASEQRAVVIDGQIVIRERMKVTMSCDHRVVDGAAGAEFMKTLRQYIEQPLRLMI